jgi:hypothetical protein
LCINTVSTRDGKPGFSLVCASGALGSIAPDMRVQDRVAFWRLLELGSDIPDKASRGPQSLATLVKSEIAKWTPIINSASIKME